MTWTTNPVLFVKEAQNRRVNNVNKAKKKNQHPFYSGTMFWFFIMAAIEYSVALQQFLGFRQLLFDAIGCKNYHYNEGQPA